MDGTIELNGLLWKWKFEEKLERAAAWRRRALGSISGSAVVRLIFSWWNLLWRQAFKKEGHLKSHPYPGRSLPCWIFSFWRAQVDQELKFDTRSLDFKDLILVTRYSFSGRTPGRWSGCRNCSLGRGSLDVKTGRDRIPKRLFKHFYQTFRCWRCRPSSRTSICVIDRVWG